MKENFLLEIYTEEIPHYIQLDVQKQLSTLIINLLDEAKLDYDRYELFSTPNRIIIYIIDLDIISKPQTNIKRGPKVSADEKIVEAFAKANNTSIEELEVKKYPKGEFYTFSIETNSIQTKFLIAEYLPKLLSAVQFKKSMIWNDTKVRWSRPIRSILCMLGKEVIKFNFAGLESTNIVYGHRMICNNSQSKVSHVDEYFHILDSNMVMYNQQKRENVIITAVEEFANKHNIKPYLPKSLLQELSYLVEYPVVSCGVIDDKYLSLPPELLTYMIVKNQRYIIFYQPDGRIHKNFMIVLNIKPDTPQIEQKIIEGNYRVVRARLEDALFFFNNDIKNNMISSISKLSDIIFFKDIGSMLDKTHRLRLIVEQLCTYHDCSIEIDQMRQAADLCKVDLCSNVVREFPEMQGIMGGYMAIHQGFDVEIAQGISEHYRPLGVNDSLPSNRVGAILSIADKLDNLISLFAVGKKPTGSGDPMALRRSALGIFRIIIEFKLPIRLSELFTKETYDDLLQFFYDRISVFYRSQGINHNLIQLVLAHDNNDLCLLSINESLVQLNDIYKLQLLEKFIAIYKRISNIMPDNIDIQPDYFVQNTSILSLDIEHEVIDIYLKISKLDITHTMLYTRLDLIFKYLDTLDKFLDEVKINVEEQELQHGRLQLLGCLLESFNNLTKVDTII